SKLLLEIGSAVSSVEVQYKGQISTHSEHNIPLALSYKKLRLYWRRPRRFFSFLGNIL
ncbi:hypothetical protein Nmel_010586, partial [Mimus melanotis]